MVGVFLWVVFLATCQYLSAILLGRRDFCWRRMVGLSLLTAATAAAGLVGLDRSLVP